jgi:hypothetical protein
VSVSAWIACVAWLAAAIVTAAIRAAKGIREGRGDRAAARLKSPTVYLFSGYLLIAALVTPVSPGETISPLLGLALAVPLAYGLATLSAIGSEEPSPTARVALAILHGGVVLAAGSIILALASPAFVPAWLRAY